MSWLKIDDGFAQHPKIVGLSDKAFRLHMVALCYCAQHLTDGRLETGPLKSCRNVAGATHRHVTELVAAGVWDVRDGVEYVRDFLEYNPSAAEVKAKRQAAKERMALARSSREQNAKFARSSPNPGPAPARKELKALADKSLRSVG